MPVWCGAGGGCDGDDVVMAMPLLRWAWRGGALIAGSLSASGAPPRARARVSWRNRGRFRFRCGVSASQVTLGCALVACSSLGVLRLICKLVNITARNLGPRFASEVRFEHDGRRDGVVVS